MLLVGWRRAGRSPQHRLLAECCARATLLSILLVCCARQVCFDYLTHPQHPHNQEPRQERRQQQQQQNLNALSRHLHAPGRTVPRRRLLLQPLSVSAVVIGGTHNVEAALAESPWPTFPALPFPSRAPIQLFEDGQILTTQKASPEISKVLGVQLLRTTYETVEAWGSFPSMAVYQASFGNRIRGGFEKFRARYQNYDLSAIFNTSNLVATGGGVTNRFYFCFLNDAQFRVIGQRVERAGSREGFGRLLGERLYKKILAGDVLRADVSEEQLKDLPQEVRDVMFVGKWPALEGPLPKGRSPAELQAGVRKLLGYLKQVGYCKGFEVSAITSSTWPSEPSLVFTSYVDAPVNLEATIALMRSNGNFAPRYDQRMLQAYFADCGVESDFDDELAEGFNVPPSFPPTTRIIQGVKTRWVLKMGDD